MCVQILDQSVWSLLPQLSQRECKIGPRGDTKFAIKGQSCGFGTVKKKPDQGDTGRPCLFLLVFQSLQEIVEALTDILEVSNGFHYKIGSSYNTKVLARDSL